MKIPVWCLSLVLLAAIVAANTASTPDPHIAALPKPAPVWIKEKAETLNKVDGSNKTFNLSHTPNDVVEIGVFLNGLYQSEGDDYTVNPSNSRQLIYGQAPPAGSLLRFWYIANP